MNVYIPKSDFSPIVSIRRVKHGKKVTRGHYECRLKCGHTVNRFFSQDGGNEPNKIHCDQCADLLDANRKAQLEMNLKTAA